MPDATPASSSPLPWDALDPAVVLHAIPHLLAADQAPVIAATARLAETIAARWAHRVRHAAALVADGRVEGTCVHLFRILDNARRFREPSPEADALRRTLMADGIGRQLAQPWSARLMWLERLHTALTGRFAGVVESAHLGWMVDDLGRELRLAARRVSPVHADDDAVFRAAARLNGALRGAIERALAAGVEPARLVPEPRWAIRRASKAPMRSPRPTAEPAVSDDGLDQSTTERATLKPIS